MSQTHTNGTRNPEIDEQLGEEEEEVAEEKNKLQRKKNKLTGKDQFRVRVTVYLSTITSRGLYIHQSHTQTTKPKAITETDQPGLFGLLLPTCQQYRDHDMLVVTKNLKFSNVKGSAESTLRRPAFSDAGVGKNLSISTRPVVVFQVEEEEEGGG